MLVDYPTTIPVSYNRISTELRFKSRLFKIHQKDTIHS